MIDYDAIVVGAGHNGLVCATYLAKAGKKVLVLEANEAPGGCAATREFAPGFKVSSCAQWLTQLNPQVCSDLELERHGLKWAARDLSSVSLAVDGSHLILAGDQVSGAGVSEADRAALVAFNARMHKFAKLLAKVFAVRPPTLVESNLRDRITLLKLGVGMKMLGKDDMSELMRIALINMYDIMEEHFDNEQLKAMLSLDGVLGAHMGPRSPNSVFAYLHRRVGEVFGYAGPAQPVGGVGALGLAMANSARAAGVEIRTGQAVAKVSLAENRTAGVTLADGSEITSRIVVSSADPVTTFETLVGFRNIETGVVRRVSQIRYKSGTAKLHLALDGPVKFTGLDVSLHGHRLVIAPDMDYVERAFNAVKYSEFSAAPAFDISIPTVNDPGLAPGGQHVLSAIVQYAPYEPAGGWDEHRSAFIDLAIDCIEQYAPGLRSKVVASELLTPQDLEREYGMRGGHWHHTELSLDQIMMMRPFPGSSQYATPVDGLYLCGAGTHPGGGIMGLAGSNAAREIIKRGSAA